MHRAALWLVVLGLTFALGAWETNPADPAVASAAPGSRVGKSVWAYPASDPLARTHDLIPKYGLTTRPNPSEPFYAAVPAKGIAVVLAYMDEHRSALMLRHALERAASHDLPAPVYVDDESAEAIEAVLERPMTLHASELALSSVLKDIERIIETPITVVWGNLPAKPTDPVTFHGRTTARRVLRSVLQSDDGYSSIDYKVGSGAMELGQPLYNVSVYGPRFPMARLRVYPAQHLRAQGLAADGVRAAFLDAFGYDSERKSSWRPVPAPVWYEPAGAVVVAASSLAHERAQGKLRDIEVLPPSAPPKPASVLDRSVPLDRERRGLPQFVEYLAQQTGSPVFLRCHWLPTDNTDPQIEGDGQGGPLREQLARILKRVQLGALAVGDGICITTLREATSGR